MEKITLTLDAETIAKRLMPATRPKNRVAGNIFLEICSGSAILTLAKRHHASGQSSGNLD